MTELEYVLLFCRTFLEIESMALLTSILVQRQKCQRVFQVKMRLFLFIYLFLLGPTYIIVFWSYVLWCNLSNPIPIG